MSRSYVYIENSSAKSNRRSSKENLPNSEDLHENYKIITKEMQDHVRQSKLQLFHESTNDILNNLQEEEKIKFDHLKNRNSILDLDLLQDSSREELSKRKKRVQSNKDIQRQINLNDSSFSQSRDYNLSSTEMKDQKAFYERELAFIQKKNYDLDVMRNMKREEEKQKNPNKPQLNENSKKMRPVSAVPLYLRTQEVIERKTNKIDNLKRLYTELENSETAQLHSQAKNTNMQPVDDYRINEFLHQQNIWCQKKEEKIERMKTDKKNNEIKSETSFFKPNINKTSETLARLKTQGNNDTENHLPTYDRLYNEHDRQKLRMHKLQSDQAPSFTPTINKNKPKYVNSRLSFLNNEMDNSSAANTKKGKSNKSKKLNNSQQDIPLSKKSNKDHSFEILNKNPKHNKKNTTDTKNNNIKKKEIKWQDQINGINIANDNAENSDILYKLNVRSASAWDKDKENSVYFDPKYASIVERIMK